jgi:hypothetical protein
MEWAAGNLLRRDWPTDSQELHEKAQDKLRSLKQLLQAERREAEAEQMSLAAERNRQRDLVIRLSWQGESDLELEVKEPIGTVCSFTHRQSPGGGILIGNNLADRFHETYSAAQAFSGEYQVTVRRIWGRPLGSKATLEIIEHQGTNSETRQRETLVFERSKDLTVVLKEGRRKSVAQVPASSTAARTPSAAVVSQNSDRILNKLRALADPESSFGTGIQGTTVSAGQPAPFAGGVPPPARANGEQLTFQGMVTSGVGNSVDFTTQATVSADRRYVRLSLAPVFETVTNVQSGPIVTNPLIPGGMQFSRP